MSRHNFECRYVGEYPTTYFKCYSIIVLFTNITQLVVYHAVFSIQFLYC